MKPTRIKDVVGPIMVGPSSSHTAGALRIAQMTRNMLSGEPVSAIFTLYGSFSRTYRGHGTDKALVAGMLGFAADDLRIGDSFEIAEEQGFSFEFVPEPDVRVSHPNTVEIEATDTTGSTVTVRGVSVGGGVAELQRIDGIDVHVTGEFTCLIVHQDDHPGVLAHVSGCLARANVNIGTVAMNRTRPGGDAFVAFDIDDPVSQETVDEILQHEAIRSVNVVQKETPRESNGIHSDPRMTPDEAQALFEELDFDYGTELLEYCEAHGKGIGETFLEREEAILAMDGEGPASIAEYLDRVLAVMRESIDRPIERPEKSMGGLIGGEAAAMSELGSRDGSSACSDELSKLSTYALAVLETNASMGRIVAAPTAGSAGVLPAVLFTLAEEHGFGREDLHLALANAAAVGCLISRNATVAGAEGGCQAEIGSASAMAASAAVELMGGTPRMCLRAASNAIASMLGLVCDPIGGLVEAPCQKRNATGAANALVSAQMALAGMENLVPFDETVEAMKEVGHSLPPELRETALGGMAACPSCSIAGRDRKTAQRHGGARRQGRMADRRG